MTLNKRESAFRPLFNSLIPDFLDNISYWGSNSTNIPPANIKETEKEYKVEIAAPGIPKEKINIHVDNNVLVIEGDVE